MSGIITDNDGIRTVNEETCRRCFGRGSYFRGEGYTRADLIPCERCKGSGMSTSNPRKRDARRNKAPNKYDGIENLQSVEAV
jgi:hypothetical protein